MVKLQNFFIFFIVILPSIVSQELINCDRSCPGANISDVPYPFGFSPGCQIQLNCTSNGTVLMGEFPVQQINHDYLLVSLPAKCGRRVDALSHLFCEHYAPVSTNAILLENCFDEMKNCIIPTTTLRNHFEILNCSSGQGGLGDLNCYCSDTSRMFLDYENITTMGCRFLFSGIVADMIGYSDAVSVEYRMIKLGCWLKGSCDCSGDADCTKIRSPVDGSDGYRCKCIKSIKVNES